MQRDRIAAGEAGRDIPARLYRRFLTWALILTLTLGATWGVVNLAWIMFSLGPVPASHVQAHGQVQVFGFLYLFIIGVAYRIIPRFAGRPLRFPGLAGATFVFLLAGVLARGIGQPIGDLGAGQFLLIVSAALYLMGMAGFAANVIGTTASRRRPAAGDAPPPRLPDVKNGPPARRAPRNPLLESYVLAGVFWMMVSTLIAAVQAIVLADRGLTSLPLAWQRPLWFLAIYGGALSWVFGVGTRVIPGFLATAPARPGLVRAGFFSLQGGNLAMALSSLLIAGGDDGLARQFRLFAMSAVGLAVLLTLAGTNGLRSSGHRRATGSAPPMFRAFVRAAFYWAALGALLLLLTAALEWGTGREPHSLLQDAVRHVFTVGLFVMMVLGMAARIVPVFEGVDVAHPGLMRWSFHLLNAGILLRLAEVGAAYLEPRLMLVAGFSGFVVLAGIIGMAVVLFGTMKRGRRAAPAAALSLMA